MAAPLVVVADPQLPVEKAFDMFGLPGNESAAVSVITDTEEERAAHAEKVRERKAQKRRAQKAKRKVKEGQDKCPAP